MAIRENTTVCGLEVAEYVIGCVKELAPTYFDKNDEFELVDAFLRRILLDDIFKTGDIGTLLEGYLPEHQINLLYRGAKRLSASYIEHNLDLSDDREIHAFKILEGYQLEITVMEYEHIEIEKRNHDEHMDYVPERLR